VQRRLIDAGLALGYMTLIFVLSAQSTFPQALAGIWTFDKVIHGVEYGVLAILIARALRPRSGAAFAAAVLASVYGATDEAHQYYVPGRSSDRYDILADAVGAVIGAALFAFHSRRSSRVKRGT
jgi:VanZ family protein